MFSWVQNYLALIDLLVEIICKQFDFLITYLIILEITNWQILIILKAYET